MSEFFTLGAITLPGDLEWIDEFSWSPVGQQVDVTLGGSLIVEESAQLAGRPITLRTGQSGNPLSSGYNAFASRWTETRFIPMITDWSRIDAAAGTKRLTLAPAAAPAN